MERKKKLRFLQLILLLAATLIIVFTYSKRDNELQDKIISKETEKKYKNKLPHNQKMVIFFSILSILASI